MASKGWYRLVGSPGAGPSTLFRSTDDIVGGCSLFINATQIFLGESLLYLSSSTPFAS